MGENYYRGRSQLGEGVKLGKVEVEEVKEGANNKSFPTPSDLDFPLTPNPHYNTHLLLRLSFYLF